MRHTTRTTHVVTRTRSLVDVLTQYFFHLNDGPSTPLGLSLPVRAGTAGFTLAYYTRCLPNPGNSYKIYLDGGGGVNASMDAYGRGGGWAGSNYYVQGTLTTQGPFIVFNPGVFQLVVLTYPGAYGNGEIDFNKYVGDTNRANGLPALDFAHIRLWERVLSPAEISGATLPRDVSQLYTANNYALGDTVLLDQTGSGRNATLYY